LFEVDAQLPSMACILLSGCITVTFEEL